MPVHWGGFALAQHDWFEPADRFAAAAQTQQLQTDYPGMGILFSYQQERLTTPWWPELR
ncbi:MAG: hypothetical protein AAFR61_32715 [Bacteroidota bacterium]